MRTPLLFLEGNAGISGDMILAAFLDLGFPLDKLRQSLEALPVPLDVQENRVKKNGLGSRTVLPVLPEKGRQEWKTSDFTAFLEKSTLSPALKSKASSLFKSLAEAEGAVHETETKNLHFHELGGWDTLLDFVGASAALEHFSLSEILVGPLNVGGGIVESAHGPLPVPAPAVLELLKGYYLYSSGIQAELVTPTGAAIVKTFGKPAPRIPPMKLREIGCGAGKQNLPFPNVLRLFLGEAEPTMEPLFATQPLLKLETNIDDMNPQFLDHIFELLHEAGAIDLWITPAFMKKNRPGYVLNLLASKEEEEALTKILFEETTTLGIRKELVERTVLERKFIEIHTPYGKIPCKIGYENGRVLNIAPEYEAIKKISKEKKIPLKQLYHFVMKEVPWPQS